MGKFHEHIRKRLSSTFLHSPQNCNVSHLFSFHVLLFEELTRRQCNYYLLLLAGKIINRIDAGPVGPKTSVKPKMLIVTGLIR